MMVALAGKMLERGCNDVGIMNVCARTMTDDGTHGAGTMLV